MIFELVLVAVVALVLYGLIAATGKLLDLRQGRVKIDERMTDHRSRL